MPEIRRLVEISKNLNSVDPYFSMMQMAKGNYDFINNICLKQIEFYDDENP